MKRDDCVSIKEEAREGRGPVPAVGDLGAEIEVEMSHFFKAGGDGSALDGPPGKSE